MIPIAAIVLVLAADQPSQGAPAAPASAKTIDTCALLTDANVRKALGDAVNARTPVNQPAGGLLMKQCHFGTSGGHDVSLAVAEPASSGGSSLTPRIYWRRQFHSSEREKGEEGERHARQIKRVGEEAYWSGSRIAGALYVLQGNTFIRVSVGGIRTEPERIEKSKALARAVLERLAIRDEGFVRRSRPDPVRRRRP